MIWLTPQAQISLWVDMDAVESIPRCGQEGEGLRQGHIIGIDCIASGQVIRPADDADGNIGHIVDRAAAIGPTRGVSR